jgi:hypothetical protein
MTDIEQQDQENEPSISIADELIKALIGKVAENGSAIRENTEHVKKLMEPVSRLPLYDKQLSMLRESIDHLGGSTTKEMQAGLGRQEAATENLGAAITKLTETVTLPVDAIGDLREDLHRHEQLFEKPLQKTVHYKHFLGRSLLVFATLLLLVTVLTVCLIRAWGRAGRYAENDIKWRYVRLSNDNLLLNALDSADESYKADPEQFGRTVSDEEDRRQKLFEKWRQQWETQQQIRELEEKKK